LRNGGLLMKRSSSRRIAFSMAIVGQLAAAIGLPLPVFSYQSTEPTPAKVESPCGCSPVDSAAQHCCCCCAGAGTSTDSCRVPHLQDTKSETKTSEPALQVRWAGGVLKERCLGATEYALSAVYVLAFPAGSPDCWQFDWAFRSWLRVGSESPAAIVSLPGTPPPRETHISATILT
jgi:hypothetical protein